MKLTDERFKQLDDPTLTRDNRALLRCRLASELMHAGQYESAREALGDLWQGIGARPELRGLSILTTAEVLLQCGALSHWLGSVHQIAGAQDKAKDLLTEALRKFKSQGRPSKVSEVRYEMGVCYWRAGSYDDARVVFSEALEGLSEKDTNLRARLLIGRTLVEISENRYHCAWEILREAETFFESCSEGLKGRWHGQKGLVLRKLATSEGRADYMDRAIIEYTAAIYHYEQANNERYCATNLNNLAFLLYKLMRYEEAHEHLDRASRLLIDLKDDGLLAQVNETRARVLVAEHRYNEASPIISGVIQTLEKGGEAGLLADALAIQGVVWARLGNYDNSINILRRAINVAQDSGALSNAGLAALTLIEEHGSSRLSERELYNIYRRADELLKSTQDAEDTARLRACARIVTRKLLGARLSDKNFSLPKAMLDYEERFIREALELEQGSVTRAAHRLGIKHQTLTHLLNKHHRKLLSLRTPPVSRKQGIIRDDKKR